MERFTSFTTGRRRLRASRVVFGAAAAGAAVLLAACSSSSSSSSGSTAPTTAGGSSSSASGSSANLSALADGVNQAAAVPSFSTYAADYGGKVPNISNLAGKKIMIIPGVSALAACTEIAQADAAIATAAGMKPTIFENQGTTAEHNTAIENAIHQGYAAIDMGCAMDPCTCQRAWSRLDLCQNDCQQLRQHDRVSFRSLCCGQNPAPRKAVLHHSASPDGSG